MRVVGFDATGLDDSSAARGGGALPGSVRLPDNDDDDDGESIAKDRAMGAGGGKNRSRRGSGATDDGVTLDTGQPAMLHGALVGKTLGVFGPGSRVRIWCWSILRYR